MSKYAISTPSREEFYRQIRKQREREKRKRKLKDINWFMIVGVVLILAGVYVYYKTDFMLHDLAGVLIGALGVVPILGRFIGIGEGDYVYEREDSGFMEDMFDTSESMIFDDLYEHNTDVLTDPAYSSLGVNILNDD